MAKVTATLDGFEATKRAIAAAAPLAKVYASDAVAKSTFAVERTAQGLAPRGLTGRLKASITSKATATTGRVGIAGSVSSSPKYKGPEAYWRFVEYGTVRVPARPFFRPAAEREKAAFIKRMQDIGPRLERDLSSGRTL